MSLARAHRERMLAEKSAAQAADASGARHGAAASEYELMRARLGVDLRRLREIQSREKKIELKAELLPAYGPWVDGVLAAGTAAQDDILLHVMIWRIDTGDYAGAMPLIRHVVAHKLDLPERFDRTAPTMIAEEIAEAALAAHGQGEPFDLAVLEEVAEIVADEDIFDVVRAKLHKAIGLQLQRVAEATEATADGPAGARAAAFTRARANFVRALALDANAGVKKRIESIERELKKLGANATEQQS
jgi:hypothetical protein